MPARTLPAGVGLGPSDCSSLGCNSPLVGMWNSLVSQCQCFCPDGSPPFPDGTCGASASGGCPPGQIPNPLMPDQCMPNPLGGGDGGSGGCPSGQIPNPLMPGQCMPNPLGGGGGGSGGCPSGQIPNPLMPGQCMPNPFGSSGLPFPFPTTGGCPSGQIPNPLMPGQCLPNPFGTSLPIPTGCAPGSFPNPLTGQCVSLSGGCPAGQIASPLGGCIPFPPLPVPGQLMTVCPGGLPSIGGACLPLPGLPGFPAIPPLFPWGTQPTSLDCPAGSSKIAGYCVPGSWPGIGPLGGPFGSMGQLIPPLPGLFKGVLAPSAQNQCGEGYVSVAGYCVPDLTGLRAALPPNVAATLPVGFPLGTLLPTLLGCGAGSISIAGFCVPLSAGLPSSGPLPGLFGGMLPLPEIPAGFPAGTFLPNANGACADGYSAIGGFCVPKIDTALVPTNPCDPLPVWTDPSTGTLYCLDCGPNASVDLSDPANPACDCDPGYGRNASDQCAPLPQDNPQILASTCPDGSPANADGSCPPPPSPAILQAPGEYVSGGSPDETTPEADNTATYLLIGGGALLAGGLLYFATRKK